MPDLKSELMKLDNLKFDDDVGNEPAPITPTTNFTKTMWDAIKATPNMNSIQIAERINGGSMAGIATRLKQMVDRGTLSRHTDKHGLFVYQAVGDAYLSMSRTEVIAKAQAARKENQARRKKQREYNAKYLAKKHATNPQVIQVVGAPAAIPSASLNMHPNAADLVNQMSIGLAKAVYLELKKVFEA
jgi:hypothetical protein